METYGKTAGLVALLLIPALVGSVSGLYLGAGAGILLGSTALGITSIVFLSCESCCECDDF